MSKVVVGMSGGVDSAVTAYLLKEEGYDVTGVTLKIWASEEDKPSKCCEIDDARAVCLKLGIPFYPLNCESAFKENVIDPFVEEYLAGRTPNPCIECNRYVKWERMLYYAKVLHADYIATGHYAHVVKLDNGRYTVKKANFAQKDQTYMLYKLSQEQLSKTLMPLGNLSKDEVRDIASKAGLPVASKPDSQDICFVREDSYADLIVNHTDGNVPGEGNFVDESGRVLGRHKGIIHYTIGQRKGLGIAAGARIFVKEIRPETNEVVLSDEDAIFDRTVIVKDVNFLSIPELKEGEKLKCNAKIRYHHNAEPAFIENIGDGLVKIEFDKPVRAATPGQSSVFYDDNECVIGGGIIIKK